MRVSSKSALALAMAGLTAVEILIPPVASARPTCQDTSTMTICQTNGSVSIKARPGTVAPPANMPVFPWFAGPRRRR